MRQTTAFITQARHSHFLSESASQKGRCNTPGETCQQRSVTSVRIFLFNFGGVFFLLRLLLRLAVGVFL